MPRPGDIFLQLAQFLAQAREQEKIQTRAREDEFRIAQQLARFQTEERIRERQAQLEGERAPLGAAQTERINAATSINELPTPSGLLASLRTDPRFKPSSEALQPSRFPIVNIPGMGAREEALLPVRQPGEAVPTEEQLIAALNARREVLESLPQAAAERGSRIVSGEQVTGSPGAPIRTERTASEEAGREVLTTAIAGPGRAEQAGAVARASTPPSIREGVGPTGDPAFVRVPAFGGDAQAIGGATPAPDAASSGGSDFLIVAQKLPLLKALSQQINVGEGFLGQFLPGSARQFMGFLGEDAVAQAMQDTIEPLSLALASIVNRGRPTEPDRTAAMKLLPRFQTNARWAAILIKNMENLLGQVNQGGVESVQQFGNGNLAAFLTTGLADEELRSVLGADYTTLITPGGGQAPNAAAEIVENPDGTLTIRRRGGGL